MELSIVIAMLSLLSLIGTLGNASVVHIFHRKEDTHTYTIFLIAKAITDFLTCLLVIPFTIYMEYFDFYIKYDFLCKLYQFSITSSIPYSAFLIVAISIHMYLSICHPFLKVRTCTVFRAKILCVILGVISATIGLLVGLMFGVYQETGSSPFITHGNGTQNLSLETYGHDLSKEKEINFTGLCQPNFLIISEEFMVGYQKFYTALFALCFAVIIIMYSLIYCSHVVKHTKLFQRQKTKSLDLTVSQSNGGDANSLSKDTEVTLVGKMTETSLQKSAGECTKCTKSFKTSSTKRNQNLQRTARMLFMMAMAFFATYFPAFLMTNQVIEYNMVVFYMYFANNVVNAFIYLCMSETFRQEIKTLLCKK